MHYPTEPLVPREGWTGVTRTIRTGAPEDSRTFILEPTSVSDPSMIQGEVRILGWDEMAALDAADAPDPEPELEVPARPRRRR